MFQLLRNNKKLLLLLVGSFLGGTDAWTTSEAHRRPSRSRVRIIPSSSRLFLCSNNNKPPSTTLQHEAETLIRKAVRDVGYTRMVEIVWKGDRISVTVRSSDSTADSLNSGAGRVNHEDPFHVMDGDNLLLLSRAIQAILDDGEEDENSSGAQIALNYQVEVTPPGVADNDELRGIMFESYKGFDVIVDCQLSDKKKKSSVTRKRLTGRLVERNEEQTIINIKGRMKKVDNTDVFSVRLPKTKKEKGGR